MEELEEIEGWTVSPTAMHTEQGSMLVRDTDTGNSKGFAFVNYASFDASDAAIEGMHGQYLCNRAVSYQSNTAFEVERLSISNPDYINA